MPDDLAEAHRHLADARAFGRCGDVELSLRCHQLAAEIARHEQDHASAIAEATSGIHLADSCGFGRWSTELRIELAKAYLTACRPTDALDTGIAALEMSEHPDCQYAWGVADALQLLGVAYDQLDQKDRARDYLQRALEKRRLLHCS